MEITSTIITRTACQESDRARFAIEYSTVDNRLQRIQMNIFTPATDAEPEETYRGNAYFDGREFTCNIPFTEDIPYYIEKALEVIRQIMEETSAEAASAVLADDTIQNKTSR